MKQKWSVESSGRESKLLIRKKKSKTQSQLQSGRRKAEELQGE